MKSFEPKKIYIAGPMSKGDRVKNLAQGLVVYRELILAGHAPFCPMLSFFAGPFVDAGHGDWLAADLPWLRSADAVVRLPGESVGAEIEVAEARKIGIPVHFGLDACLLAIGRREQ